MLPTKLVMTSVLVGGSTPTRKLLPGTCTDLVTSACSKVVSGVASPSSPPV